MSSGRALTCLSDPNLNTSLSFLKSLRGYPLAIASLEYRLQSRKLPSRHMTSKRRRTDVDVVLF